VDKAAGLAGSRAFRKVGDPSKPPEKRSKPKPSGEQVVTLIKTNFEALEYQGDPQAAKTLGRGERNRSVRDEDEVQGASG
jgi:hypothetical protein